jgi:hypothetical protein
MAVRAGAQSISWQMDLLACPHRENRTVRCHHIAHLDPAIRPFVMSAFMVLPLPEAAHRIVGERG